MTATTVLTWEGVAPASAALVRERFVTAARAALGAELATRLAAFVDTLEDRADAGELARLTRIAGGR